MENGIAYVSVGDERRQLLFDSIASARRFHPDQPVHVISDVPLDTSFTWVRHHADSRESFYKTQLAQLLPFSITLFSSIELQFQAAAGDFESILADHDLALVRDPHLPVLAPLATDARAIRGLSPGELILMQQLAAQKPQMPLFDTRLIFFRKSEKTLRLFEAWHEEWMRFEGPDQTALARALHRLPAQVKSLSDFDIVAHRDTDQPARPLGSRIVHFSQLTAQGLPLTPPHQAFAVFSHATRHGLCTAQQYEALGRLVVAHRPLRMLIFGCGADSSLWAVLNKKGQTRFVESKSEFADPAAAAGLEVVMYDFATRRGEPAGSELKALPGFLTESQWDLVFVDGPQGYAPYHPGRELPIYWAAQLPGNPIIVAHDYERIWERACCDRYLGPPDFWLAGTARQPHEMAFWLRGQAPITAML